MKPKLLITIGWFWLIASLLSLVEITSSTIQVIRHWNIISATYQGVPMRGLENIIKATTVFYDNLTLMLASWVFLSIFSAVTSVRFIQLKSSALKFFKLICGVYIVLGLSGWAWFVSFKLAADADGVGLKYGYGHYPYSIYQCTFYNRFHTRSTIGNWRFSGICKTSYHEL